MIANLALIAIFQCKASPLSYILSNHLPIKINEKVNTKRITQKAQVIYPVHNSQIHSHQEDPRREMNPLGDIAQQLMVEALNIECISTLVYIINNTLLV